MEGRSIKKLREVASKYGYKVEKLPSGAVLFIKDNEAEIQLLTILDSYYVKYIKSGKAYLIYDLDDGTVEAIFKETLNELGGDNVVEIPPY
jgi:hypothetical protein